MRPPCAGKWQLFDSTHPDDHELARQFCVACPLIGECRRQLEQARVSGRTAIRGGGPRGTWAGQLMGGPDRVSTAKHAEEEARYDEDDARRAHARFIAGERDEWTVIGNRVYDRRRTRRRRERVA